MIDHTKVLKTSSKKKNKRYSVLKPDEFSKPLKTSNDSKNVKDKKTKASKMMTYSRTEKSKAKYKMFMSRFRDLDSEYRYSKRSDISHGDRLAMAVQEKLLKEQRSATVLQKILRGHVARLFVRALLWMNKFHNLKKVYSYFDVNRKSSLPLLLCLFVYISAYCHSIDLTCYIHHG